MSNGCAARRVAHSLWPGFDTVKRLLRLVRGQDWWFYKIPPMLAAGYATALVFDVPVRHTLVALAAVLAAVCAVASFGYVINDLFDIAQDRRAGKRNTMARIGPTGRAVALALPLLAGFAIIIAIGGGRTALGLLAVNFALPALYSIPPVRLKERGVLGVIADAGAAHLLPTALMVTAVLPIERQVTTFGWWFLATACGWAFFSGVRGIIVHQVADRAADRRADVETFGGRIGITRARRLTFLGIVPLEVASLAGFLALVIPFAPAVAIATLLFAACELQKIRLRWTLPMFESPAKSTERYVPLINNEFYEVWLPLALAVQLALAHREFIAVPVFQALAFAPNLYARGSGMRALIAPAAWSHKR